MIVNDDLRAFTRLPQLMGAAARRKEGDLVWAKITGNPTMSEDSTTLFHADHSNLESSAAGTVDTDKLSAARAAMRKQTGPGGATLDLQPRFLLVPVAQETDAEVLLRSTALPETNYSQGVHNPWANRLVPIAEPRLDNDSVKAWYLVADPNQIDTIEVAYLDGREEPYTEEEVQFERDAVGYKIRHDFGCGVMDYRGFFKNPGE
jgi:phage major head subunit gpT-like protein